ncbi:carbohydrate kinase family protein [Azospirillum halopraeferens]|uniref:carbohydrate kinase family protein n=1 Tax=Azospirillum halopraeferens TaxID=34010 RepID=UPI0004155139|nr:carbohydrate kinase [Azospirillum halopraeferens]
MILSCGEALIDFLPAPTGGAAGYVPHPGGSPFNVAVGIARLGAPAGFLGGVSTDFFGDLLVGALARDGVDRRFVVRSGAPTTLAFVSLPDGGEPRYAFYGTGAADRALEAAALPADLGPVRAIHTGSFSLAVEPVGTALGTLLARERGRRFLSLDPNVRPAIIGDRDAFRRRLDGLLGLVDLVKVSGADLDWLDPGLPPEAVAERWLGLGPHLVVVTGGAGGARAYRRGGSLAVAADPVTVVDTVGAGDAFMAGLLAGLHERGGLGSGTLGAMPDAELAAVLRFANRVAALTCARPGADPPRRDEVARQEAAALSTPTNRA